MQKIRLTYRAFTRTSRAVEDQFERVYQDVLELCHNQGIPAREVDPLHVSGPDTSYWPLSEEAKVRAQKEGVATAFDLQGDKHVALVRQWVITIILRESPTEHIPGFIETIWEKAGNVFTNVEIIQEVFTDVAPQ